MFTGLVQALGLVQNIASINPEVPQDGMGLTVRAEHALLKGLTPGASIAIDGACTTIVDFTEEDGRVTYYPDRRAGFVIEASPETLSKTIMGQYEEGCMVNLELPLTLNAPLGGHFVTGHVDGTGQLVSKVSNGLSWVYRFQVDDASHMPLLVEKGSITVSGVSLTVNTIIGDVFSVAIIPHTYQNTTFGQLEAGAPVNLETDLLGKYVQRLLGTSGISQVTPAFQAHANASPAVSGLPSRTYLTEPNIHTGDWFNHQ